VLTCRLLPFDLDLVNVRQPRPLPAPAEERLYALPDCFELRFDAPVEAIANPTADAERERAAS
jgi:hypothetical protein